jgi:H+/Na+-translocating ferredoxin:NAD+ oxidoreductase subunit B
VEAAGIVGVSESLAGRIDALLPQTQCTKCGYPGCRPYADAVAAGRAEINQCPPGGDAGIRALARLLGREYRPLDPKHGVEGVRRVAVIDEARCIGCTLCIQACPVDAILGAARQMHTVLAGLCSGCDLCVAPCPVDCIAMVPAGADDVWDRGRADAARARHEWRKARLARDACETALKKTAAARKRAVVQAAIARARAKKSAAARRER